MIPAQCSECQRQEIQAAQVNGRSKYNSLKVAKFPRGLWFKPEAPNLHGSGPHRGQGVATAEIYLCWLTQNQLSCRVQTVCAHLDAELRRQQDASPGGNRGNGRWICLQSSRLGPEWARERQLSVPCNWASRWTKMPFTVLRAARGGNRLEIYLGLANGNHTARSRICLG